MKIRDLFDKSKNIDRRIEKVINYGAADVNSLRQEIIEYVATDSIEKNFEKLLDLLDAGMEGGWNQEVGVWVSGFYGSGKSSFTKYLGFALGSEITIDDKPFIEWLKNQFKSLPLKQRLTTVAKKHPATVVMLDLASEQLAGATMAEISSVLFYKVMQWAGYSRDKKISQLEYKLEENGKMDLFKSRVLELTKGVKWEEIHNRPLESKTYASRLAPEFYKELWPDSKSFNEIVIDEAEAVDKRIEKMISLIKRRSSKENIIFVLDEVGQYVAARDDLILNLDGLAKIIKSLGQGHVWLIATAQQTLTEDDPRAQMNTAKLFKLKDRFPIPIDLEASDIKEICYRRLLSKSKEGDAFLQSLFDSNGQSLRLFTKLVNTRYYSSADLDKKTFCDLYPFLPQHFDILLELLGRLAKTSGGIGLRSAIKVIQDILVDKSGLRPGETLVADKDTRMLVTTATFYDTLRVDLQKSFRHIVSGVEKVEKIFGPDSVQAQGAKSIAVLQVLEDFPVNRENLAAVMHPSVDSVSLAADVSKAVDEMLKEPSIPLNEIDGSLRFMSEAVLELEQEKMKLVIRPADTRSVFHTKLREIFTPAPSSYLNGSRVVTSGVKALSGSMQIPLVGEKDVIQTLIEFIPDSKYEERKNETIKDSLQNSYRYTTLLLGREDSGIENLLDEICRCNGIYTQHHNKAVEKEVRDYLNGQYQRAENTLKPELESRLLKSLSGGSFLFRGKAEAVKTLGDDCRDAAKKYLGAIAAEVFDKYGEAPVQVESNLAERFLKADRIDKIASKDDPLELIKKAGATVSINTQHKAIVSIKDYLERFGQVEGRKLLEDFFAPPYGWSKDTMRYLISAMLIAGEIKLRVSGEDITVRGEAAINSIKNTNSFNKIGIALRNTKPPLAFLDRARERLLKLTGEDVLPLEDEISKSVIKHFPDFQQDYAPLAVQLGNLGLSGIEKAQSIQEGIAEILKGDASDATNRLGAADCPFYENLLWAQEVKKAFDNKIDLVIRKANQYVSDLPKLPNLGITGQLIDDTLQDRETLSDRKGRDDFYNQMIDMQNCVSSIETRIKSAVSDLLTEEEGYKSSEVKMLQGLPEWKQLGEDDRNWFQSEIDKIQITAADGLGGLQQLLNIHYVLEKELRRLEQEILARAKHAGKKDEKEEKAGSEGEVFDADFSSLPSEVSSSKDIDDIIQSLQGLKEKFNIFKKIRILWR